MRPPTPDAVERALAILIQSINKENKTSFASRRSQQKLDQTLAQFNENDQALQLARRYINTAIKKWSASLRKPRNALLHIGRIPVELMLEILLSSLRVKDRSGVKRLQQLASVTTRWRDLILSFPRFWTTIHSNDSVALKLRRSQNMPLTIALHWNFGNQLHISTSTMIKEHLNRCRNLQLSVQPLYYFTEHLGMGEMPLLETVDCSGYDARDTMFFQLPPASMVHSLRLKSVAVDWDALAGLRNLYISDIDNSDYGPSAMELAHALRSCPLLEVLKLENLRYELDSSHEAFSNEGAKKGQPIELPRLRTLILRWIKPEGTAPLLSSIRAKSLLEFQLVETAEVEGGICTKECQALIQTVIRNSSTNRITINITQTCVEMEGAGRKVGQVKLRLDYADQCLHILDGLAKSVPEGVCVDLRTFLSLTRINLNQMDMVSTILDHLHGIESLSLSMHPEMINRVVEKLSTPHDAADQATLGVRWPAHRLSRLRVTTSPLHLDFDCIEAGLAALLESRSPAKDGDLPELKVFDDAGYIFVVTNGEIEWLRYWLPWSVVSIQPV